MNSQSVSSKDIVHTDGPQQIVKGNMRAKVLRPAPRPVPEGFTIPPSADDNPSADDEGGDR